MVDGKDPVDPKDPFGEHSESTSKDKETKEEILHSHRSQLKVEKFTGTNNFGLWRTDVMDVLVHLDLEEALEGRPAEMSDKQWNKMNKLCLGSIRGCLATSVRVNYQHETSAKDLWEKLEKEYLVKNVANRIHLKRNLYRYNMKKGATLTEHLDSYNKLLDELVNYDEKINDEEQALCLINSLPERYEPVIKALMHGKDKMTYAEVTTALRSEEIRKMDREDLSSEANSDLLLARGRSTDSMNA